MDQIGPKMFSNSNIRVEARLENKRVVQLFESTEIILIDVYCMGR